MLCHIHYTRSQSTTCKKIVTTRDLSNAGFSPKCKQLSPDLRYVDLKYETMTPIGWHRPFMIGWSKYDIPLHMGSHDRWEFPPYFKPQWQSFCIALTAGIKCLPLELYKGAVKQSTAADISRNRRFMNRASTGRVVMRMETKWELYSDINIICLH